MKLNLWNTNLNPRELSKQNIEVWSPIPETDETYYVSNFSRVYSVRSAAVLNGTVNNAGRMTVGIYKAKKEKPVTYLVYRLSVWAFDGPPPDDSMTDVRHLDGDQTNNMLHNIEYGTRSQNMRDVVRHRTEGKQKVSANSRKPVWYAGDLLNSELAQRALSLYDKKLLTIEGISALLNCSVSAAANMVKGRTEYDVQLPERGLGNGRQGENHHAAVCSDAALAEAFQLYVDNHWSGVEFANHLNIIQLTAHMILSGRSRNTVPRPEGFQYPWPDAASLNRRYGEEHGCAKLTEAQIYDVFARIETGELKNMKEVQAALGVAKGIAYGIVAGRSWAHLTRSDALKAAVTKMQRQILSPQDQTAVIDALLAGEPRDEIKARFNLSDSKLQSYITKANKKKQNV